MKVDKETQERLNNYMQSEIECQAAWEQPSEWLLVLQSNCGAFLYVPIIDGEISENDSILEGESGELFYLDWENAMEQWGSMLGCEKTDDDFWGMERIKDTLELKIQKLIDYAKENDKVFVFGDEVYTPDEAESAMLAHAEEDIEGQGISEDEYIERQRACMASKEA